MKILILRITLRKLQISKKNSKIKNILRIRILVNIGPYVFCVSDVAGSTFSLLSNHSVEVSKPTTRLQGTYTCQAHLVQQDENGTVGDITTVFTNVIEVMVIGRSLLGYHTTDMNNCNLTTFDFKSVQGISTLFDAKFTATESSGCL